MPERFTVWSPALSLTETLASALSVGCWFTGLTVTVKVRVTVLLLTPPSLIVTVMVDEPKPKPRGANVSEPVVAGLV